MIPIKGFENYLISKDGTIYSLFYKKQVKVSYDRAGYVRTRLCSKNGRKSVFIHRLLAINFIPNPENKPFVNHIDGNKSNNELSNLEWCTQKENARHAWNNGFYKNHKETLIKAHEACSKKLLDIETSKIYKSISDASRNLNIPFTTFKRIIDKTNRFKYI